MEKGDKREFVIDGFEGDRQMKLLKRCYGCNKFIWPWSKTVNTEKVGIVHKACLIDAYQKHLIDGTFPGWIRTYHKEQLVRAIEYLNTKE